MTRVHDRCINCGETIYANTSAASQLQGVWVHHATGGPYCGIEETTVASPISIGRRKEA